MESKSVMLLLFLMFLPITALPGTKIQKAAMQENKKFNKNGRNETAESVPATAELVARLLQRKIQQSQPADQIPVRPQIATDLLTREQGAGLLFNYLASPTESGQILLESYLQKFPDAHEIREKFSGKAIAVGHLKLPVATGSVTKRPRTGMNWKVVKTVVAILVILLIVWQAIELAFDLKAKK